MSRFPKQSERFGKYFLEILVDEDKSGRVYQATDEDLSRAVCLKIFSPELSHNSSFLDVLRVQMQSAASLNEGGLLPLYDMGEHNGFCYIATEWSPTGWLSQQVVKHGKYTLSEALELIIRCAEILRSASETGLYHGNLRLNSVVIYPEHEIKISEIGFVAAVRALYGGTNLPVYLGAARFLAPEMTGSGTVDHRADIYSLGLILYFLLFSVAPFRYEGEKLTGETETVEPEHMDDVLKIVSKMTENNRENRYQEYGKLLADLRSLYDRAVPFIRIPVLKQASGADPIRNQKMFKLLCAVYASSIQGALIVTEENIKRTFLIRNREIIFSQSSQPEESIWAWLVEKKEIDPKNSPSSREPLQRALNRLITKGFLKLEDFRFRYQEMMNRQLADLLKRPSAEAEFISGEIEGEAICSIRIGGLLLKASRYSIDFKDVLTDIKSDSFLHRTGLFDHLVTGLQLTDEENLLVQVSQDGIFTGSLKVSAGSSAEKGLRFLYLLKQIGALELRSSTDTTIPLPSEPDVMPASASVVHMDDFQLADATSDIAKADSVRMEIQRTAVKADQDRLDMEAERRYEMAKEFYKNGKYWEASHYCELALGLHEDARYYWLMGLSYSQHPRFRHKAEDSFHRALRLDPLNDELHADLGQFYVSQGLYMRARSHCKKALEIIPDHVRALEILAEPAFRSLGPGGCCCEHDPGCNHEEHKAWRIKK